ncbi:uncharacterized protein JCM15063_002572 [Sporobolomyces koalae]|uniref:uncharacterized protein n=1 Tax=Sporobolomyces koalae TaxID=500713 RepID=UPI00316CCEDB
MLCLDDSKSVSDWSGNAASIIAALGAGATGIIYAVARLIEVKQRGGTVSNSSPVRRLARREEEERVFGNVTIGGVEVEVPFVLDAEGKSTMNLLDFYSQASPSLETRAFSEETALPTGGTMTFYANGTLDTFTVDFAVPFTADATSSTLAKRDSNSLHTTYWAAPGHEHTSLSNYYLEGLVRASYTLQGSHVWESCGYMANSGTWHGAFRHWTGDRGYTNGECELARKY